jgi:dCMP deaminase
MEGYMTVKWDKYFFDICHVVATKSKDESTQVGAVIVGPGREIRSTGYNSFPRGINDYIAERQVRPEKYKWFEHAERSAIYHAARVGTPVEGCVLYVPWTPCSDCSRGIIQAGIVEVIIETADIPDRWKNDTAIGLQMLKEAGVRVRYMEARVASQRMGE